MQIKIIIRVLAAIAAIIVALVITACTPARKLTLMEIYALIKTKQFIDLTHCFEPGIPHWPGFPARVFAILP